MTAKGNQFFAEAQQQEDQNRQERVEQLALILSLRNTLQTVAQMRKAQQDLMRDGPRMAKTREALLKEVKRLETAVDMRLSQLEIKAVG